MRAEWYVKPERLLINIVPSQFYSVKYCSYFSRFVLSETWAYRKAVRISPMKPTYDARAFAPDKDILIENT